MDNNSYVIVGAGVMGLSTALHLKESIPDASVTLLDRGPAPYPSAASSDLNKIVRADYPDMAYMKLGLEAVDKWRNDKLYFPWYHESGILLADEVNMGAGAYANYKTLGIDPGVSFLSADEARTKFPVFKNSDWTGVDKMFYNSRSGWAEADKVVAAVFEAATNAGVNFVQATVSKLLLNEDGDCTGVIAEDGSTIQGRYVLLCTGAGTAKLLADSAPERKNLQVKGRLTAAGACSCIVKCAPEHRHLYQDAPVHILGIHTRGENVPMDKEGRLKFNLILSFTNNEYHEASGQTISVPPTDMKQTTWSQDVPSKLKDDLTRVVRHICGSDAPGLSVESFRMCWDSVTPDQDWIISPISSCKGLYIAAGGSFHCWKFLPVHGKYISQMLHGELSDELRQKWSWDRAIDTGKKKMYAPEIDLKDIPGYGDI
jgi:sarcosine oxidase / L-pipecolate oxidase